MFKADIILYNGNVITMDNLYPKATAIATWKNKIIGVGDYKDMDSLKGPQTKLINMNKKTILPGFNDSHCHLPITGTSLLSIDLLDKGIKCIDDIKKRVAERAKNSLPGEWIQGWGYDHTKLKENRHPNRWDLDEVAPNNPVILKRACGHVVTVNSKALKLANINKDTPNPMNGFIVRSDSSKEPSGVLEESALALAKDAIPPYTVEQLAEAIKLGSELYASQGITSIADGASLHSFAADDEPAAWKLALEKGMLNTRVYIMMDCLRAKKYLHAQKAAWFDSDILRFGAIKYFLDGGIGTGTAALKEPYDTDRDNHGMMTMSREELFQHVKEDHDAGFQLAIHAIGDDAVEMLINALENAIRQNPRPDHRHRIEHCSLCSPTLQDKVAELKLIASMQPVFLMELGDSHINNIGDRAKHEFPIKSLLKKGVVITNGTDRPVVEGHPRTGLYSAVARKTLNGKILGKDESISMRQAIWTYTYAGAYATFEERIKGTITPGKLADLVVLSLDPCNVPIDEVLNMEVLMTIFNGKIIYDAYDG